MEEGGFLEDYFVGLTPVPNFVLYGSTIQFCMLTHFIILKSPSTLSKFMSMALIMQLITFL